LNEKFSFINSTENVTELEYSVKTNSTTVFVVDKSDAPQTEIRIGHPVNHRNNPDYYARLLMNLILGGQFSSRLNANLREKRGLTYGVRSFFSYNKQGGYFCVSASVDTAKTFEAVSEIIEELNGIRNEITNTELEFAKSSVIKKYPLNFETYGQIASNMITKLVYNLGNNYFETYTERIKSIDVDEVLEAARSNIKPDNLVIVLVGNKEVISKQLTGLTGVSIQYCKG
jgi:zinc protease